MAKEGNTVVDLVEAIDTRLRRVHTQSLDISFNEILDMHKNGELDISPDYQRLFQWSPGARSRFIESLLLEMPVPPIYVIEMEDGRYTLIDGLQRISSYLHFRGALSAPHLEPPIKLGNKLVLQECDIVTELNGRKYDDLGAALQMKLKRAFVRVEVIRKGSDPRFRYHMFKRLNTGGQLLTAQQIRNCTIRLLDPTFNDFIIELSETEDFKLCTSTLSQERALSAFKQELVLRFFAFKNYIAKFRHDVADFLTEYMEHVSEPELAKRLDFDYVCEEASFKRTFKLLAKTLGSHSFSYASKRGTLTLGFSVYHFEAFTVGVQSVLEKIDLGDSSQLKKCKIALEGIKLDADFIRITTGGGKNSPGPLRERIGFVRDCLEAAL